MAAATQKRIWTRKPLHRVEINWNHPFAKDLRHYSLLNDGAGNITDLTNGAVGVRESNTAWFFDEDRGVRCTSTTSGSRMRFDPTITTDADDNQYTILGDMTVQFELSVDNIAGGGSVCFAVEAGAGETSAENSCCWVRVDASGGNKRLRFIHENGSGNNGANHQMSNVFTTGVRTVCTIVRDVSANTLRFFYNGEFQEQNSYTTDPDGTTDPDLTLGDRGGSGGLFPLDADYYGATYYAATALSDEEVRSLAANVYQVLVPRRTFFLIGGAQTFEEVHTYTATGSVVASQGFLSQQSFSYSAIGTPTLTKVIDIVRTYTATGTVALSKAVDVVRGFTATATVALTQALIVGETHVYTATATVTEALQTFVEGAGSKVVKAYTVFMASLFGFRGKK